MGGSGTKPAFESYIHNKSVKRGEDIVFSCKTNIEEVEVRWCKDDQRLYDGGRIDINKSGTYLTLKIRQAKEEDEGKYTVRISNGEDSASDSATVTLLEYDRDWRSVEWGQNVAIRHSLEDLRFSNPDTRHVRLLLHGPVGSGKSSIINSINSIFQGRVMVGALACSAASTSFTTVFKTYQIRDRQGRDVPFVFNDIMGLEDTQDEGVHPDDIISAIDGHIPDKYRFDPSCPLSRRDPRYKSSPPLSDRVHCLVSVISCDSISRVEDSIIEKMRDVRKHASDQGIPQVVLMTHVDVTCPLVKDDLKRVYSSKRIKQKMQECSNRLGVPMNCIYPLRNYHEENHLDPNMDSLILDALQKAVMFAADYVGSLEAEPNTPSPWLREEEREIDVESGAESPVSSEDSDAEIRQDEPDFNIASSSASAVYALPVDPEFDIEWRRMNWDTGNRNRMERELREFRLLNPELKHLRILLHGPVGAGKSSLINSIDTVFQGQVSARALVATGVGFSFTKKYKTHKFRNGNSGHLPFVLNDIMGLENKNSVGAHPDDIISALKGHVKNNFKFNPASPLSEGDPDYNSNPTLNERVHCLVSVVSMDTISRMDDDIITKMQAIREAASDLDIPQAIIMTMADRACPIVKEDVRKMFLSKKIKEKMQECSHKFGIPMNCIFPVKNYHEETDLDQEMDCLILTALRQLVHFAHEYVDSMDDD
ncbi:uncharacterized protein LOC134458165 [Engraulis encrasicolus]|uniref:uncharacterized protein LOC134458165 n=1 Tax=Engraulis encrasicolus TaxID=184585 RepID=UPI002FD55B78